MVTIFIHPFSLLSRVQAFKAEIFVFVWQSKYAHDIVSHSLFYSLAMLQLILPIVTFSSFNNCCDKLNYSLFSRVGLGWGSWWNSHVLDVCFNVVLRNMYKETQPCFALCKNFQEAANLKSLFGDWIFMKYVYELTKHATTFTEHVGIIFCLRDNPWRNRELKMGYWLTVISIVVRNLRMEPRSLRS